MFEAISVGVYFVWATLYYGLYLSYKIGKFLVTTAGVLLENTFIFFNNILEIFVAIFEAFTVFYQDIVQCLQQLYHICFYVIELGINGVSTVFYNFSNIIEGLVLYIVTAYNFIINSVLNVISVVGHIFIFLKRVIVLFGSGVWFSVTLIPLFIVYLITLCVYYSGRLLEEIVDSITTSVGTVKSALKNVFQFLTDVPIESAAGIIVAICLAYLATQFYIVLYSYVHEQFRNLLWRIRNRYNNLQRVRQRQAARGTSSTVRMTPRGRPEIRRKVSFPEPPTNESELDDRYCVVCQERTRCILLLPCRHMCMCDECSDRLQLYNNTCPICRKDIENNMKIFV